MKTKKFLSMAALALVGAMMTGCSSDEDFSNPQQPENKSKVVTLTTTVGLDGGATTRALTPAGVKTFAVGETMAVIYHNGTSTVKAVSHALEAGDITNAGKNATFTFDLETPNKSGSVLYIYPAAMAGDTGVDVTKLNTQEGTFDALQSKYDLCTNFGDWDGDNLPSLTLENQLAILAINLKNGSTDITSTITGMTISDGTNNYAVSGISSASTIYVAILPTASANIDITATDDVNNYEKSLTNKTYEKNNGYNVSWSMIPKVNLSSRSGQLDVTGDMIITGTPAGDLNIKLPNKECTVTLDNVNPLGAHSVTIEGSNSSMTVKLKGTSKLETIQATFATALIIEEAAPGGTVIIESDNLTPLDNGHVTINGGTVMARMNVDFFEAVSGNLTVNGGAVYLAGGQNTTAVWGTITAGTGVTLYGWDGSQWDSSDTATQYVTSDNLSGNPASWTYWQ